MRTTNTQPAKCSCLNNCFSLLPLISLQLPDTASATNLQLSSSREGQHIHLSVQESARTRLLHIKGKKTLMPEDNFPPRTLHLGRHSRHGAFSANPHIAPPLRSITTSFPTNPTTPPHRPLLTSAPPHLLTLPNSFFTTPRVPEPLEPHIIRIESQCNSRNASLSATPPPSRAVSGYQAKFSSNSILNTPESLMLAGEVFCRPCSEVRLALPLCGIHYCIDLEWRAICLRCSEIFLAPIRTNLLFRKH